LLQHRVECVEYKADNITDQVQVGHSILPHLSHEQVEHGGGCITQRIGGCSQSSEEQNIATNIVEQIVDCLGDQGVEEGVEALEGDAHGRGWVAVEEVDDNRIGSHCQSLKIKKSVLISNISDVALLERSSS